MRHIDYTADIQFFIDVYVEANCAYSGVSCHSKPATARKFNRQTNDQTSQRFGKIKRATTHRTKPPLYSTFAFAPTAQPPFDKPKVA